MASPLCHFILLSLTVLKRRDALIHYNLRANTNKGKRPFSFSLPLPVSTPTPPTPINKWGIRTSRARAGNLQKKLGGLQPPRHPGQRPAASVRGAQESQK